jgi:hypothetical protein
VVREGDDEVRREVEGDVGVRPRRVVVEVLDGLSASSNGFGVGDIAIGVTSLFDSGGNGASTGDDGLDSTDAKSNGDEGLVRSP